MITELMINCGNFDMLNEKSIANDDSCRQTPARMKTIPTCEGVGVHL